MVGALIVLCSPGVPRPAWAGELPRVAVGYSSFPNGTFAYRDEYATDLTRLAWPMEAFENKHLGDLIERLDDFDLLILATGWNRERIQDLRPHSDRLRQFLRYGGVILLTDAYHETETDWLVTIDPDLGFLPRSDLPRAVPGQRAWLDTRHPLLAGITNLPVPELLPPRASSLWQVLARSADGGPTLVCREIGDGIIVAIALLRHGGFPDARFLQNLWLWARDEGRINAVREREQVAYRALTEPKELEARRIDPPVIDGIVEEAAWNNAAQTAQFVGYDGSAVAPQETHALVGLDDYWLYVAFRCADRDPAEPGHESVELLIDPTGQGTEPLRFVVTSSGRMEGPHTSPAPAGRVSGPTWWQSAVRVAPDSWSAEMRIPLVALGDVKTSAQEWAINFARHDASTSELSVWAPITAPYLLWGKLTKVAVDPNLCPIRPNRIELTGTRLSASFAKPSYGDFHGRYVVECTSPSGVTRETARELAIREFDSLAIETDHRMDEPGTWLLRARVEVEGGLVWISEAMEVNVGEW